MATPFIYGPFIECHDKSKAFNRLSYFCIRWFNHWRVSPVHISFFSLWFNFYLILDRTDLLKLVIIDGTLIFSARREWEELKKAVESPKPDRPRILSLLRQTTSERRRYVKQDLKLVKNIGTVIEQFPHLKNVKYVSLLVFKLISMWI